MTSILFFFTFLDNSKSRITNHRRARIANNGNLFAFFYFVIEYFNFSRSFRSWYGTNGALMLKCRSKCDEICVSSQVIKVHPLSISTARKVMSPKFPMGVAMTNNVP
jgi:hypothetical protein